MHKSTVVTTKFIKNTTTVSITQAPNGTVIEVDVIDRSSFKMTMKEAQALRDILNEAVKEGLI